jgi:hypothetical protein
LSDEIGVSVFDLELEKHSVSCKYLEVNSDSYLIEVRLNLSLNEFHFGYYVSVLDQHGIEVDDYLVFK